MAISSQAPQECGEGSTTRAWSPDRTVEPHERAATKTCTKCSVPKSPDRFSGRSSWCKDCINAYSKTHYQKRSDHVKALKVAYRATHKEKVSKLNAEWREKNLDKAIEYLRKYRKANRAKFNAHEAKRYARKTQATPKWADLSAIEAVYKLAKEVTVKTGVRRSVDHIYPLRGKLVSGLHVPENLRVIPYLENCKKRNKMPVEDIV